MAAPSARKRILVVLEHGRSMPSGVVRALIFRDSFEQAGHKTTFIDHYTDLDRYIRGVNRLYPLISRHLIPLMAVHADAVFLSKVTSLKLIRRIREHAPQTRIVLDFGDALWLKDQDEAESFGQLLGAVDAVTTDNELTAEYVRKFNTSCSVIYDCPQVELFDLRRTAMSRSDDGTTIIGWVGSPSTTYNLYVVWEALEQLFKRHPNLHLRLLGADPNRLPPFENVRFSNIKTYNQARMVDEVLKMHIGLFPLQDTEACRVRGILKPTVYMSGGAVPVCSPVGQSVDLIQDGSNGMLARDTSDWIEKIEKLIADPDARARLARTAVEEMRTNFTIAEAFKQLESAIVANERQENI